MRRDGEGLGRISEISPHLIERVTTHKVQVALSSREFAVPQVLPQDINRHPRHMSTPCEGPAKGLKGSRLDILKPHLAPGLLPKLAQGSVVDGEYGITGHQANHAPLSKDPLGLGTEGQGG